MKNKYTLSIIIPCFGKRNEVVLRTLESAAKVKNNNPDKIEIIFVYKNSIDYNYDWVKKNIDINKVIKVDDSNAKKTRKIYEALLKTNSKYSYILDADDILVDKYFNKLIDNLNKEVSDVVLINVIDSKESNLNDCKLKKTYIHSKNMLPLYYSLPNKLTSLTANTVYKTDFLTNVYYKMTDKVLYCDDIYRTLVYLHKTNSIKNYKNIYICNYIIYNSSEDSVKKQIIDKYSDIYIVLEEILSIKEDHFYTKNTKIIKRNFHILFFDLFKVYKKTKNTEVREKIHCYKKRISNKYSINFFLINILLFFNR